MTESLQVDLLTLEGQNCLCIPPTHLYRNALEGDHHGRTVVRADAPGQPSGGLAPGVFSSARCPGAVVHGRSLDARKILQDSLQPLLHGGL